MMLKVITKVKWNQVMKVGGYVAAGVMGAMEAYEKAQMTDKIFKLTKEVAELKAKMK